MLRKIHFLTLFLIFLYPVLSEGRGVGRNSFEVRGVVVPQRGISTNSGQVVIQLQGLSGPWSGKDPSTVVQKRGRFRYNGVPTGTYLLTVSMPRVAFTRRTLEVGPSLANKDGRIEITVPLAARRRRPGMFEVPAEELSLPAAAREEYDKGLQQLKDRNLALAEEHFRRATDCAPQHFAAWYQLGAIATRRERYADAATFYRNALKVRPESYRALVDLGEVLLILRDVEGALAVNAQAVKIRPDDAQALVQMGYSLLIADRLEEAETHFKEAVTLDPANYRYPQLMLAEIYRRRKDLPAVKREFEEFLRLHPDTPKAREIRSALDELHPLVK